MTTRTKYDFERLDKYCKENGVILLDDYSNEKITRDIFVKGKCVYENCVNEFEKKIRELINTGGYCKNCIKIMANERRKQFCLEKYGCEIASQSKIVQEKSKKNMFRKIRS